MITLKEFPGKSFNTSEEALKELIANKKTIIAQKKGAIKLADPFQFSGWTKNDQNAEKAESQTKEANVLNVVAVSNACNYLDSHGDVSINGSWNRTAKNTKNGLHLQ